MVRKYIFLVFTGVVLIGRYYRWHQTVEYSSQGQVAPGDPLQVSVMLSWFQFKEQYSVYPLATFDITARVLSKEEYRWDAGADLVPIDLALGRWPMSDDTLLSQLEISQWYRWFRRYGDLSALPRQDIESHASNMHLIPAHTEIGQRIASVRKWSIIRLQGYLVNVTRADGRHWESSLSRTDVGAGACELVFVNEFTIIQW